MEQTDFFPEGTEIPGEPFEITVNKIRSSLAFAFSGETLSAKVSVTDGKRCATFTIGSRDYDLDDRFTGDPTIKFEDVTSLQALAIKIATHKPARTYRSQELPMGIVPVGAETEDIISGTPGLQLRLQEVRMPLGQGKPVKYYTKRAE